MNRKKKKPTSSKNTRAGSLSIEIALCLPILLMVLFGSYELARANMILHSTESAAYEGARTGIIPGATPEKVRESARVLLTAVGINNFTVNVDPQVIDETTEVVSVTVLVPFRENMSFPAFFMQDPTFRGNCQLSREIVR